MAQTGYTPISIYYSATASNTPTAGNLVAGELAINTADGKLFYKDSSGVVQTIATKGGVNGTSSGQVLFNNSGVIGGSNNLFWDITNGNLGIGTNSPSVKLNVSSASSNIATFNSSTDGYIAITQSGSAATILGAISTTGFVGTSNNNDFTFRTVNAERMRIDTAGNVGIGTNSVGSILDIVGSGNPTLTLRGSAGAYTAILKLQAAGGGFSVINATGASSDALIFQTTGTERMRVASDGRVLIGTTSNFNASFVSIVAGSNRGLGISTSGNGAHVLQVDNSSTTYADLGGGMLYIQANGAVEAAYRAISVYAAGGARFAVRGDGTIYSTNTSVQSISDVRFKENIKDIDTGLTEILQLKPRRFDWKKGKGTGEINVAGFIAQEIETIFPELVNEFKDNLDDETMYKSVGYAGLIPSLVKAIQELNDKLTVLETQLGVK